MAAETSIDLDATSTAKGVQGRLLVEFELAGECYGVDIADIREIIRYQAITTVPGTPDIVEGIINLRSRVTPIVDLRKRIGLRPAELDDAARIIVIELDDALVGVHVDAVTGVVSLSAEQLKALSDDVTTDRSDYLEGVADFDGRLIVLINLQRALEGGVSTGDPAASAGLPATQPVPTVTTQADPPLPDAATEEVSAVVAAGVAPTVEQTAGADLDQTDEPAGEEIDLGLRIDLLEQSSEALQPRAADLVSLVHDKLVEQDTASEALFENTEAGDWAEEAAAIVRLLSQPSALVPHLEQLGSGPALSAVEPTQYELVGSVLIESMGEIAGDSWTDEIRDAWADALTLFAAVMIDGASNAEATVAPLELDEPVEAPVLDEMASETPEAKRPTAKKTAAKKPAAKKPGAKKTTRKAATA